MRIGIGIGIPRTKHRGSVGIGLPVMDGLILALDADLGVTLNGSNVSAWADQSGNGNHLTQSTPGAQPLLVPNWRNGKAAIHGDGISQFIDRATFVGGEIAQANTIYTVLSWPSVLAGTLHIACSGTGGSRQDLSTSGTAVRAITNLVGSLPGAATAGAASITRSFFDQAASEIFVENDGEAAVSGVVSVGTVAMNGACLLSIAGGGSPSELNIAGFLVYDRRLTVQEDADVLAFLSDRYNIVST